LIFPSVQFAVFFVLVLPLSWLLMPKQSVWKPFILVASYVFYAAASWKFCFLLAAVTLVSQLAAVGMSRSENERARRYMMIGGVAFDLGILGVFKYYGFFSQQVSAVFNSLGVGSPVPLLQLALPVGISFFSFQAVSYVVDVWRGRVQRAKLLDAGVYLSFFPHLVAGPIVRASEFLPQLKKPRDPRRVAVGAGITLIASGVFMKVVIADYLARALVDPVFAVPQAYGGLDVLLGAYGFAVQIYCDFAGYTNIAIGLALLLGFIFPENFNKPYRSLSVREFWTRWHMTLSRFMRDFLYIPLGGNRKGKWRTYLNLMITMMLAGLWHGASWTFVLWGAWNGIGLVVNHILDGRLKMPKWLAWLLTFNFIVFGWILFRATSVTEVGELLSRLASLGHLSLLTWQTGLAIVAVIGIQLLPLEPLARIRLRLWHARPVLLGAGLAFVIIVSAATVSTQGVPPFIYFRF